jgi:hypothetical protein
MIHIEKDQKIAENENLRVATATGDYEDAALIEFYEISKPGIATGSFQAQFIKYGGVVYKFNDPKELGNEILRIDPESTHTAASYVRMTNELLVQMNGGTLEPGSLDQVLATEQVKMEEAIENPVTDVATSSTPSGVEPIVENVTFPETPVVESVAPVPIETGTSTTTISDTVNTTPDLIDTTTSVIEEIAGTANTVVSTTEAIAEIVEGVVDTTTSTP